MLQNEREMRLVGWLVVSFYGISTLFGSFNAKLSHSDKTFKQFSLIKVQFVVYSQLHVKTVLFQTIQFCINTEFSSIWPIDKTLSGATTLV